MSWLEDLDYTYNYQCKCGHVTQITQNAKQGHTEYITCEDCGQPAGYRGFVPQKMGGGTCVTYEKNGRKARRYTDGNGTVHHMSETKRRYLETGKIESQITRPYAEQVQNRTEREFRKFERQRALAAESSATVTTAGKAAAKEG